MTLSAALVLARAAGCLGAVTALEAQVAALGPRLTKTPPPVAPWSVAQRARLAVAKLTRKKEAASQARNSAASAATEAARTLAAAEERLAEVSRALEAALQEESTAVAALQAALGPPTELLGEVVKLLADDGKGRLSDGRLAGALEIARLELLSRVTHQQKASTLVQETAQPSPAAALPRRAPWEDADALTAVSGSDIDGVDEIDDAWAYVCTATHRSRRVCPDDEVHVGFRVEYWTTAKSRCRLHAGAGGSGDSAPPSVQLGAGVAEVRRAVDTVKVALTPGAFSPALDGACSQLAGALLTGGAAPSEEATAAPEARAEAPAPEQGLSPPTHPVFVAVAGAAGRTHATC